VKWICTKQLIQLKQTHHATLNLFFMQKVILHFFLIVSLCFYGLNARGQTNLYNYSVLSGTFTDISSTGTVIAPGTAGIAGWAPLGSYWIDLTNTNIPIGFTFNFCGTNYTQLSACNHLWLSFINSSSTIFVNTPGFIPFSATGVPTGFLMLYWDDICGSGSSAYYQTSGTAPNRIFTLQYTDQRFWTTGWGCAGNADMQVKLYESTNVIEYWYGPNSWSYYSPASYPNGATIGIANSVWTGSGMSTDYKTVDAGFATATYGSFYASHTLLPSDGTILRWSTCSVTATPSNSGAVCPGGTVTLTATTSGTGWSWSGPSGYTSTLLSPVITPTVSGAYVFSAWGPYLSGTCTTTATTMVTVNPVPAAPVITPSVTTMCNGATLTITSSATATWSPFTNLFTDAGCTIPYTGSSTTTVYVHPTTISTPTVFTYTATVTNTFGCSNTATSTVTVNPATAAVTGTLLVCAGYTTTLASTSSGGTWSSSSPGIGTVGSTTGVVGGITSGTTTILYTVAGCSTAAVVTVTPSPSAITGINIACLGATTTLTTTPAGGTWSSSSPSIGTVGSTTGIVYGVSVGTTTITYDLGSGCYVTRTVSVNAYPSAIAGSGSLCVGTSTVLSSTPTGGIWTASSSPPGVATVIPAGPTAGTVNGLALGTSTISYQVAGCSVTRTVTVVSATGPSIGPASVCVGSTGSYTNGTPGGTWSSSSTAVGTIGSTSGILTGLSTGTTTLTYALSPSCTSLLVVTVTAAPAAIVGPASLCEGLTTTLTHPVAGGTWSSSNPAIATIGIGSGDVLAVSALPAPGTTTITYTTPSGCFATMNFTVLPLPSAITGTMSLCQLQTATLGSATVGGTWSSGTTAVATIVSTSGDWTAVGVGTSSITYTAGTGCITTATVTANGLPATITGPATVCAGQTITLSDATPGGAWSSSNPAVGTVSGTGDVYGVAAGTTDITYAVASGCYVTQTVTVNAAPAAITGPLGMCVGGNTTLACATPAGTWSSSAPSVATILSPGLIGGAAAGTANISYIIGATGCSSVVTVTVNTLPGAIAGALNVCSGSTTALTNSSPGGTWAAGNPAAGTIDMATGIYTGIGSGISVVTYSLGTGCTVTATVTVNTSPGAITGTLNICQGVCATLSCTPVGGTWLSSATGIATIGSTSGSLCGVAAGTANITYTITSTGCRRVTVATVNSVPPVITGATSVCAGQCTPLTGGAGGAWSSSSPAVGTISAAGMFCGVSAGTTTVSYTLPSGCYRTITMLVNALPTSITPAAPQVCEGSTQGLTGSPVGGTWQSSSTTIGTISAGGGVLAGILAGTTTITYTITGGCYLTTTATVNPLPGAIGGTLSVCVAQTTSLTCTPAGGTWAISAGTGTATIGAATGVVTGGTSGTATVTYTLPTGCRKTAVVSINALPGIITGAANVCESATTTLNCTPAGGTWSMTCSSATIGVTTGILSGISAGTCDVTYTAGAGCYTTRNVTVNPVPSPITGTFSTCVGQTTSLSSSPSGGAWSSSPLSMGTINSSTGLFYGLSAGTPICTYTLPVTGCRATQAVTVYALPSAIGGSLQVCENSTTALTTTTPGGTWAGSNPAAGTINTTTGVLSGIAAGTTNITYTVGTGCYSTAVATVNPVPAPVTGVAQVCVGATTTLSDVTPSGVWSSGATGTATVSSGGVVTGVGAGTVNISYTLGTGCAAIAVVSVYPLPTLITGPGDVCVNANITLGSTPGGGIWSSSLPGIAAINPVTGVVTGVSAGTTIISYTQGIGCVRTMTLNVNPQPAPITGNLNVCIGLTQLLSTTSTGGTWSSSNTVVAPVSSSGLVSGSSLGTADISYTLPITGCSRSVQATVQPLPSTISGSSAFCNLSSTTYFSSPGGGTWTSADTNILVIDPSSGLATGKDTFSVNIIYTLPTGCSTTKNVSLIVAPYPITGPHSMCFGQARTLSNIIPGGVWSSSNPAVASIDPVTGVVTGMAVGLSAFCTYTLSSGCYSVYSVSVNPLPSPPTGPAQVCENYTAIYGSPTPAGTWSSSLPSVGTIDPSTGLFGGITPGTLTITYTLASGCNAIKAVTVNGLPGSIGGLFQVCEGSSVNMATTSTGGLWSTADPSVAYIDAATGVLTGISAATTGVGGMGVTMVSYTLPTGCYRTANVTVNPLPAVVTGPMNICVNDIVAYTCSTPGGGWVSSNPAAGSIDGVTGVLTGLTAGNTIVSYVRPTGCVSTLPVIVHANPAPIGGSTSVCAGFATNLTSSPSGGTWSQAPSSMGYGTIHPLTGVVSGIVAGFIPVTYTLSSGCRAVDTVEVITLPAVIGGPSSVCVNDSIVMTNPAAGGVWSSSIPARASIDPVSGLVHGLTTGTTVITYSVGTGCFNVRTIMVNPLPAPITGPLQVCEGSTVTLATTSTGGNWISDTTAHATVGYISGIVTGIAAGVSNISYVIGATGCLRAVQETVNSTPAPITGNPHICMGSSNTFSSVSPGGVWISSNPAIATIDPSSGVATSVSLGTVIISYTYLSTGCTATKLVSVDPLPVVYNVTGGGNYCYGGAGVHINLSNSQPGVSYELFRGSSVTGYLAGSGFPLDFGLHTTAGTYTVLATDVTSGCTKNMSGSANVIVIPLATPAVTITAAPYDSVCPGQTATMTPVPVNGGTAPSYLWKVNGTTVSTAAVYGFVPADGDVVTVAMTSNANCLAATTATGAKTLTVLPNRMPVAGVLTSPDDSVCQFSPVALTADPLYGGPSPSYTWIVNGVAAGTGASYMFVPVDGDVVQLQMTSNYRCRLANIVTSGDVTLSVDSMQIPVVTIWPEPGFLVTAGKPAKLHAETSHAGPTPKYQWKVNGKDIPGATENSYTAIFNDYDSISCQVISSGVCANIGASDWVFISMFALGTNGGVIPVSDIRLIPNPNKGVFTIKGSLGAGIDEDVNAEVTDMLGQVVYRGVVKARQGRVDAHVQLDRNLANGMYMLTLRTETEQKVFHFVMEQ